jgi:hypothetical protein
MQAKVDTLRAKSGEEEVLVYPKTLTKCVVNENGELVEDIARSIADEEIVSHTDLTLSADSNNPIANSAVVAGLAAVEEKIPASVTVDTALSSTSGNPIANKAVMAKFGEYLPLTGGNVESLTIDNNTALHTGISAKVVISETEPSDTSALWVW